MVALLSSPHYPRLEKNETTRFVRREPGVLVVSDDGLERSQLTTVLQRHGFRVLEAENGPSAMEILQKHPDGIAIVVVRLGMKEWSGPRILAELQKISPRLRCCFVGIPGQRCHETELLSLGADYVLNRPLSMAYLAPILWQLVQQSCWTR